MVHGCTLHAVAFVIAAVVRERVQPDHHRHFLRLAFLEKQVTSHALPKANRHAPHALGRPAIVRHQLRLGSGQELRLLRLGQVLRRLAKRPEDALTNRRLGVDCFVARFLIGVPRLPVEVVNQLLGEVAALGQGAAKRQINPVEISLTILATDLLRRRTGGVAAGPIVDPQILLGTEQSIN